MTSREATIYDVAKRAEVSISTVSLAMNQPTRVKQPTLHRILAAADELGFVPKVRAVMQARRGLGRIAVVAPFTSYPSFSRRLAGVMEELGDSGTQLLVSDCEDIAVSDSPVLASIPVRGHVDGLLNLGVPMDEKIGERLKNRLPTILLDVHFPGLPTIGVDFREGGRQVGRHLQGLGHRTVAFIKEVEQYEFDSPPNLTRAGLRDELGAEFVYEIVVERGTNAGRDGVGIVLDDPALAEMVTAFVGSRDLVAIGATAELRRRGCDVPGDFSVVGVDDDPVAEALGLTTLRHPYEESGRLAVRALRALLDDSTTQVGGQHLDLELMPRDTSGPPGPVIP